jgi:hypothetical protein
MRARPWVVLTLLLSLIPTSDLLAGPIGINVLSATYSTSVSTTVRTYDPTTLATTTTPVSRTLTSGSAIFDSLQGSPRVFAHASADTFSVGTSTSAFFDLSLNEVSAFATALADTHLEFSTAQDQTAALAFDFTGFDQAQFSSGFVSLFDLTENLTLLNYEWGYPLAGSVPWECCYQASIAHTQNLQASHVYALSMHTATDANTDEQAVALRVSGLHAVPEPSTVLLLVAGVIFTAGYRWRATCGVGGNTPRR